MKKTPNDIAKETVKQLQELRPWRVGAYADGVWRVGTLAGTFPSGRVLVIHKQAAGATICNYDKEFVRDLESLEADGIEVEPEYEDTTLEQLAKSFVADVGKLTGGDK